MNTDTPRTDEATLRAIDIEGGGEFQAVHIQVSKQLERELAAVTEQRDRLAEALESIVGESAYEGLPELKQLAIEEALQSLTPKDHE